MRDLTSGVEADVSDPVGSGKEWGEYALSAGLTAGAILTGVALIGRPLSGFVSGTVNRFAGGAGGSGDNRWEGL